MTYEDACKLFKYNPDTGLLTWKKDLRGLTKAGDIAGTQAWFVNKQNKYIRVVSKGKAYLAHRIIYMLMIGSWPDQIDHIDGNGLNNKWNNLRSVSASGNAQNQKIRSTNTSGIMGVCLNSRQNAWQAEIHHSGARKHLLTTKDFFEACCARKSAENKLGFHPNHGRR